MTQLRIQRAADGFGAFVENVGVDHSGFDIFVSEEFLHGADVVPCFEKMGCEGVAEGVGGDALL